METTITKKKKATEKNLNISYGKLNNKFISKFISLTKVNNMHSIETER